MEYAEIDCGLSIRKMKEATIKTIERNLPAFNDMTFKSCMMSLNGH